MKLKNIFILLFAVSCFLFAQETDQTFLSIKDTGVEEFLKLHPEYDGRGTIVLVLDTGVDMGIDGLKQTSTGETKVIDVQDFTHEGDVKIYEADVDEEDGKTIFSNDDENYKVTASSKFTYSAVDNDYYIGAFKESRLINSNSGAADLNGDGDTDDAYYLVAFQTTEGNDNFWVVYFDTNGNGDLADEKPLRNYKVNQDAFFIQNQSGLPELTMGLNIFPEEKIVSFHFDDGAHGTHVSGIATGYSIGGIGLNGIAPGAKVISLKLGNNLYAGGATVTESMKNAFLYADKISKELEVPCIINMSFGIGSEVEGKAEMELFLDNLTKENPYLYISLGNGNEGPGISNSGLPSSSYAVFSSGAVLTQEVGRDLYGASINRDIILYFSSRGGEVRKPDVCSPGACTSTVPNWETRDRYWGTSMASPYSAGVMSLLLSAAEKDYPGVKIPSQLLFKVLRQSATPMEGYSLLDQGHGYINAMNAYNLLKKYIDDGEIDKFETYTITSTAPNTPDYKASNLYIRDGSFINKEDVFTFVVKRNNFINSDKFYRAYNLKCDSDWLIPIQKKTYIRNDQSTMINVKFDTEKMKEPGLYCSRISAYRDDKSAFPEFDMLATVVKPYEFSADNNFRMRWKDKTIEQGLIDRYFIEVPAGQTTMHIKLSAPENTYAWTRYQFFDPDGVQLNVSHTVNTVKDVYNQEESYFNLKPGVYEVDVEGIFLASDISHYNLEVGFSSIKNLSSNELNAEDQIQVVNYFNQSESYRVSGKVLGYKQTFTVDMKGGDIFSVPFSLNDDESYRTFTIKVSKDDFNKLTDFAYQIYDTAGVVLETSGLSNKEGSITINNSAGQTTNFKLELVPAMTNSDDEILVTVEEETGFVNPDDIVVTNQKRPAVSLYPSIPKELDVKVPDTDIPVPEGCKPYGKIYFESTATDKTEYELPINFNF